MCTKKTYYTGKYFFIYRKTLGIISIALLSLFLFGCDTTEPSENKINLNPKLQSVFYWGIKDPTTLIPNFGQSVGPPIIFPIWSGNNIVYFYSSELVNNIHRKGIFKIEINPKDYSLVNNGYNIYEYDYEILDMNYNNAIDEFLLLVSKNGSTTALTIQLEGNNVIENEILADKSWSVEGIKIWNSEDGFIFFGRSPQTGISGFYSLVKDSNEVYQKQLIYAIEDPGVDRLNFITSYDGKTLYFGFNENSENYRGTMQILELSLNQKGEIPVVIFERKGGYIYVAQNPINQSLFLINYYYGGDSFIEPGGHIELFNSVTSESIDLNVRTITSKYYFITNKNPIWSPDGKHFVFSAGGFSGEGDIYYPDLWIYKNVP